MDARGNVSVPTQAPNRELRYVLGVSKDLPRRSSLYTYCRRRNGRAGPGARRSRMPPSLRFPGTQ